ncbi:MAG: hypothetical protein Q9O62_01305 [Ardenticatenia bacterium]|nr:hypothetical protein [Ardenticatenia bacterium]
MSSHVDERALEQVLAGEAPPHVEEHVTTCALCRRRAAELATEEAVLIRVLLRMCCPDSLKLGEWVAGLLPESEARNVAHHVTVCPQCQEEAALAREMLHLSTRESSLTVAARKARRLVATLLADESPSLATAPFALRGAPASGRQYQVGSLRITLDLEREAPASYTIFGLIVSEAEDIGHFEGLRVRLEQAPDVEVATTEVDDLDTFVFAHVTPGTYMIEIETGEGVAVIEDLIVGNGQH